MPKKPEAPKPPEAPFPDPPEHLTERTRHLWRTLGPANARSIERRTLFQAALEALDRAVQAREAVAAEGMTTTTETTGAVHLHPLLKVEREARQQFARLWDMLNLKW